MDYRVGVICNDGVFDPPDPGFVWPDESECLAVPTCDNLPTPPTEAGYNALTVTEVASNEDVTYHCMYSDSILSDGSGQNSFTLHCDNGTLGIMDETDTFNATVPDPFPTCRAVCDHYYIGNTQYKWVNDSSVVRTGDTALFTCPDGFYVESNTHDVSTVEKNCTWEGEFETESAKCLLIPCTMDKITEITPVEGDFEPVLPTEKHPAESLEFQCTEPDKVT